MNRLKSFCTALAAVLVLATSSYATSINYGDFVDFPTGSVMYLDVTESSATDAIPLYGEPDISGNNLDFDPLAFAAVSSGIGPIDITDGQLNFTIMANEFSGLESLVINEGGDYSFSGVGGAGTFVTANIGVRATITEVDGVAVDTPITLFGSDQFTDDMSLTGGATPLLPWDAQVFVDFGPTLAQLFPGFELGVTKAEVVIDNQLIAGREPNSVAFIAKKDFNINPAGTLIPFPEPTTAGLVLLGLLGMASSRKRPAA